MQMMRANLSIFQQNSSNSNPIPFSPQQNTPLDFNDSQTYHNSQQDSYFEPNLTQTYFPSFGGQGSSNRALSEEGDNGEDVDDVITVPTTIEPILTPPVVMRSRKESSGATPKPSGGNMAWSVREEEAVIACYMEHCTDATIGTNQTAAELWRKITASYEMARESRPHELPQRNQNSIKNRWRRMARDVFKWVGYLEEAGRIARSGEVDADVRRKAHILYRRCENSNFIYENAYDLLQRYPKWKSRVHRFLPKKRGEPNRNQASDPDTSGSGKRVRLDEDAEEDDAIGGSGSQSGGVVRPDGVKKSKAKKFKGKGSLSCSDDVAMTLGEKLQLSIEMRGVDLNLQKERLEFDKARERRMAEQFEMEKGRIQLENEHMKNQNLKVKWDMLQSLMGRSNLTPQEEAFKNKLMNDIYENK